MARQAGVEGIVTSLYDVPPGEVWTQEAIKARQEEVAAGNNLAPALQWEVVESLPISEDIKLQTGNWRRHIANYRTSLVNLAACGLEVICYNFMPVLDWTRTTLAWPVSHGGTAMRFDLIDFAAFDIHILERTGAAGDYLPAVVTAARQRAAGLTNAARQNLVANILAGLPGATESWTLAKVREQLAKYEGMTATRLRANQVAWLEEVIPEAQRLGLRLCCHPDDPPFPLLGLPRVMSTEDDYRQLVMAVASPANGITLCTGSLGVRPDNDLPKFIANLGAHIHFVHLRNITRDTNEVPCSFFEDEHLEGATDMVAVVKALLQEQDRRQASGESVIQIPMRPDHGQDILDDLGRGAQPGYPAIGRLKGLAELRGIMHALLL